MLLKDFLNKINEKIPLHLASDWDNVGLLIEPSDNFQIEKILLTNDLIEKVMQESVDKNVDLIISYHPPIFRPFKKICQSNWKERIIAKCLSNKIAVYSPHTALDAINGGINDWLLQPFKCSSIKPVETSIHKPKFEYQIQLNDDDSEKKSKIFKQLSNFIDIESNESCGIIQCNVDDLSAIINVIKENNAKFTSITKSPNLPLLHEGMGRWARLAEPLKINHVVSTLKKNLGLQKIRLALADNHTDDSIINTIGVCAGSGASILRQIGPSVDFFITGEMSHHEVLDAIHSGTSVALCEHSNTERGYIRDVLMDYLRTNFPSLTIIMSEMDKDPLEIV